MRGKPFLLYPLFLLLFLFFVDSLFRIPYVQSLAKLDLTAVNYKAKTALLDKITSGEFKLDPNRKLMFILGSSRLLYFDPKELQNFYPDWQIINLSSAVTTPAYYHYQVTRLIDAGIRPHLVVMETDPNQFNQNSVFKNSNLTYSFDLPYVIRHSATFGKEHVSFYLGRKLFAVGTYKPYLDAMWRNFQNPMLPQLLGMHEATYNYLIDNNGHGLSPIENYVEKDSDSLLLTSHRTLDWLFASYMPSPMQYEFYSKTLESFKEQKWNAVIVWPQSSPDFEALIHKEKLVRDWEMAIDEKTNQFGYSILKLKDDPNYSCNAFADGGHVAKDCYRSLMRAILLEYFRVYEPNRL